MVWMWVPHAGLSSVGKLLHTRLWTTGLMGKRCKRELGAWVRVTWGSCSWYRSLEGCSNPQVPSPGISGEKDSE